MIRESFGNAHVQNVDETGIPALAKEAVSFAILAAARLDETPANLPRVTGAASPVRMGSVYLP
jgi:1,6-anhydro-N-acetylmuramate kinase